MKALSLAKIKASSLELTLVGDVWRDVRLVPTETNYILMLCPSFQCFSAASGPKVHLQRHKPVIHLRCDCLELRAAIFGF